VVEGRWNRGGGGGSKKEKYIPPDENKAEGEGDFFYLILTLIQFPWGDWGPKSRKSDTAKITFAEQQKGEHQLKKHPN
jgi:hypothetical protein